MDINLPDGTVLKNVPPGTTREQVIEKLGRSGYDVTLLQPLTYLEKIGRGARDPWDALAQTLEHVTPAVARDYINQLGSVLGAAGVVEPSSEGLDKALEAQERKYQIRRSAGGETGVDWWRLAGAVPSGAPIAALSTSAGTPLWLSAAIMGMASAPTESAPSSESDFWTTKAGQAVLGMVSSKAFDLLGKTFRPPPEISAKAKELLKQGVRLTPGRMAGGWVAAYEDKMSSAPIMGGRVTQAQYTAVDDYNRAIWNQVLRPIGLRLPDDVPTGVQAADWVGDAISRHYDDVLLKVKGQLDPQFRQELATIQRMGATLPKVGPQLNSILRDEVTGKFTRQGLASGHTVKEIESTLGRLARGYLSDPSYDARRLGGALSEAQAALRRMLMRVNPPHAPELARTNTAFARMLRAEKAAAKAGSSGGVFSPIQFSQSVRELDPTRGKRAFARGRAMMQPMATAGTEVLGKKVPDSGTAGRASALMAPVAYMSHPSLLLTEIAAGLSSTGAARGAMEAYLTTPWLRHPVMEALSRTGTEIAPYMAPLGPAAALGYND